MWVGGTGHPRRATHLGVGRSLNKTYEGRLENILFQETLLHFFQGQLIRTHFFCIWLLKISFIKDFFSEFFFYLFFAFKSFSKLASISSNTSLKWDIACVLVLRLLHVVGAVASVICHWSGVCLIEPDHDKNQQNDLCTQRRLWSAFAECS